MSTYIGALFIGFYTSVAAEELIGEVSAVESDGSFSLKDGRTIIQWGIAVDQTGDLDELLANRRIECNILERADGFLFGDCRIAPTDRLPDSRRDFLDLLTWLPILGYANAICDSSILDEPVEVFDRLVGEIGYACRQGIPLRSETID